MPRFAAHACHLFLVMTALLILATVIDYTWSFNKGSSPQNDQLVAVVPFEYVQNQIAVYVTIGDSTQRLRFVLDSGAGKSVIDEAVAKHLQLHTQILNVFGISVAYKGYAKGYGAKQVSARVLENTEVSLWTKQGAKPLLTVPALQFCSLPLAQLGTKSAPIEGLLGQDFFQKYAIEIDFETKRIRLYQSRLFQYRGTGKMLPVQFEDSVPYVFVRIKQKGQKSFPVKMILDTGNNGELLLNYPTVKQYKLAQGIPIVHNQSSGVGGAMSEKIGRMERLTIADFSIASPLTGFSTTAKGGEESSEKYNGGIGNGVLRRFNITFDFRHRRMYLTPNHQFTSLK